MNGATPCCPTAASATTMIAPAARPCSATGRAHDPRLRVPPPAGWHGLDRHRDHDQEHERQRHQRRRPGQPQAAEHVEGGGEIGRPEEHPCDADHMEGHEPCRPRGHTEAAEALAPPALRRQRAAVDPAPDQERPRRAVPEPAEQHRDHDVAERPEPPAAVAAERDVEVVAQPARERHVPAPPEVAQREGHVGAVEVLRQLVSEQQGEADRHVGVAGEVAVDLRGERVEGERQLAGRV